MSDRVRVSLAPGWLLHRYPYRETSLILEVFTRDHGRLGLVARGARAPRRGASGVMPFTPLLLSFRHGGELGNLERSEPAGPGHALTGRAFLAASYVNELILRLLARGDAVPEVYALYEQTLALVPRDTAVAVRRFEGRLLRLLGYLPSLTHDAAGVVLDAGGTYRYDSERGLVRARDGVRGDMLLAMAREDFTDAGTLQAAAGLFRGIIGEHLHGRPLRSLDVARAVGARGAGGFE